MLSGEQSDPAQWRPDLPSRHHQRYQRWHPGPLLLPREMGPWCLLLGVGFQQPINEFKGGNHLHFGLKHGLIPTDDWYIWISKF